MNIVGDKKMKIELNNITRPTLMAVLVAAALGAALGASSAHAAVRVNMETIKTPLVANLAGGNVAIHNHIGVAATDLKAEHTAKFDSGRVVTRHVQMHQGVPVWNEAVTEHRDINQLAPSVSGFLLRNLQNDLPSVKPILSKSDALSKAKTLARIFDREEVSIDRAVKRGELPYPAKLLGRERWIAGKILNHHERRMDDAAEDAAEIAKNKG